MNAYILPQGDAEARVWLEHDPDVRQLAPKIAQEFFDQYVGPQGTTSGARGAIDAAEILKRARRRARRAVAAGRSTTAPSLLEHAPHG